MRFILTFFLLVCGTLSAETGYRYVHPDGTVEFSDQPIPGGEEIKLREAPTIQLAPAASTSEGRGKSGLSVGTGSESSAAGSIAITSPQPNQTLWFSEAGVTITISVTPALESGQTVVISLDGSDVASGSGNSFNIGQVYRGSHTVSATLLNNSGTPVSSSAPITFHMRQHSVLDRQKPTEE